MILHNGTCISQRAHTHISIHTRTRMQSNTPIPPIIPAISSAVSTVSVHTRELADVEVIACTNTKTHTQASAYAHQRKIMADVALGVNTHITTFL